jgi:hypothetical protein
MSSDQNCAAAAAPMEKRNVAIDDNDSDDDDYLTEEQIQTTIKGVSAAVQKLILKLIEKDEKRIERLTRLGKCSVNPHFSVADTFRADAAQIIKICHGISVEELETWMDSMNNKWSPKGLRYHMVKQLLLEAAQHELAEANAAAATENERVAKALARVTALM